MVTPTNSPQRELEELNTAAAEFLAGVAEFERALDDMPLVLRQLEGIPLETSKGSLQLLKTAWGYTAYVDLPGEQGPQTYPHDHFEYELNGSGGVLQGRHVRVTDVASHPSFAARGEEFPWRQLEAFELEPTFVARIIAASIMEEKF